MKTYLRYASGVRLFLDYASRYRRSLAGGACVAKNTLAQAEELLSDPRVSDGWDFARTAGDTLSRVNADPRNHFGKHALRRFDNE